MINMWRKHQTVRSVKERLIGRVLLRLHVAGDRMTNVGNPSDATGWFRRSCLEPVGWWRDLS